MGGAPDPGFDAFEKGFHVRDAGCGDAEADLELGGDEGEPEGEGGVAVGGYGGEVDDAG